MNAHEVLGRIRSEAEAGHLSESCSRGGCQVSMTDVPRSRVIVDLDRALPPGTTREKRCDYVLFLVGVRQEALVMMPMELKSGGFHATAAAEQLQQGAEFADELIQDYSGPKSICHPVLFHGKGIHEKELKSLNRAKVRFRGRQLTIKTARCGRPRNLAAVLPEEVSG